MIIEIRGDLESHEDEANGGPVGHPVPVRVRLAAGEGACVIRIISEDDRDLYTLAVDSREIREGVRAVMEAIP